MGCTEELRTVDGWFERVASSVTAASFASTHVDELLTEHFEAEPLAVSLAAFDELEERVREAGHDQAALLVMTLPPISRMVRTPPLTIKPRWLRQSPPTLYVCGALLWCAWGDDEEYRVPVEPQWFTSAYGSVHFRIHRDDRSRRKGWEFERSFYVHSGQRDDSPLPY